MVQEAENFINSLIAQGPRKDSADIERLMKEETAKGYQSLPMELAETNRWYGVGGWRPMPLHQ
eukprot:13511748-Heterocapsa_arctica.AAC.1